jgi:hypothetical protein
LSETVDESDRARHHQKPDPDQPDEKHAEPHGGYAQISRRDGPRPRYRGENREKKDRDQILDDEYPEDELSDPALHLLLLKCLDDDRRTGDADHRARENTLHRREAEQLADEVADRQHRNALKERHRPRARAHFHELLERELESEREHEQDHTQLGKRVNSRGIGDERNGDVRADDRARQQIPEHDRLMEALEYDRGHCGNAEHDRQVLEKQMRVHPENLLPTAMAKTKRPPFSGGLFNSDEGLATLPPPRSRR